jgi:quercetin dioxygenase-like cupin family protein
MIEIRKVNADSRGKLFVLSEDGVEFAHISTIKKGASRGGHVHDKPEKIIVLDGEIECLLKKAKDKNKETKGSLHEGEALIIEVGAAHLIKAKEDSVVIGVIGEAETTNYEPYRKTVEEFLANNK